MKKANISAVILVVLAVLWISQLVQSQVVAAEPERVLTDELKNMLDGESDIVIVDTRSQGSYEAGHIPGAILMPYPEGIKARAEELPLDKTIIFY